MRWIIAGLALSLTLTACEAEEEAARLTYAEETEVAGEQYSPAAYDTVRWESESAAIDRGRNIFLWACADCHGEDGRGDAGRVVDGDTIRPPSFHQENWSYADDPDALHRKVFVGNSLGMPHWGLRQMRPRDIVAVERYIRFELIQDEATPDA